MTRGQTQGKYFHLFCILYLIVYLSRCSIEGGGDGGRDEGAGGDGGYCGGWCDDDDSSSSINNSSQSVVVYCSQLSATNKVSP